MYSHDEVKPLHIMLSKESVYVNSYDGQIKWMYFLIEDELLEKYNTTWDKFNADIKKNLIESLSTIKNF